MKRMISICLAAILILGMLPGAAFAADAKATDSADILYELGLFSGTGKDANGNPVYDLDRAPTRHEAITMLVALLGKTEEAQRGAWTIPFTDVVEWAKPYVGYAYANGLTSGTSATTYGGNDKVTASQYLTFVLKALGYSSTTDFTWNKAWELSDQLGITNGQFNANTTTFTRGDVVQISEAALSAREKGATWTLADKLVAAGVFTQEQYINAYNQTQKPEKQILSAQEISEKCASAVFYIEVYSFNGELMSSGSGFFLSADGLAVTNRHVVENTLDVAITTTDGRTYSDIDIIASDIGHDLALLRVHGGSFPYLELADSDAVKQGQQVYAIGSPKGLSNTMSQGIIANPKRLMEDGSEYIQMSVPITHGSSGGALLNEYGEAIGVTAAGLGEANLNFAVPSNQIQNLDRSKTENIILFDTTYYPGFEQVLDFGAFSGVELVDAFEGTMGYIYQYDVFDFHDGLGIEASQRYVDTCYLYHDVLEDCGLKQVYVSEDMICQGIFESATERVYFETDYEDKAIYVVVAQIPKSYTLFSGLPDFGWFSGLYGSGPEVMDESLVYTYKWYGSYTVNEFVDMMDAYFDLLEQEGYALIAQENGVWLFEGHGLSVACIINEQYVFMDILRL